MGIGRSRPVISGVGTIWDLDAQVIQCLDSSHPLPLTDRGTTVKVDYLDVATWWGTWCRPFSLPRDTGVAWRHRRSIRHRDQRLHALCSTYFVPSLIFSLDLLQEIRIMTQTRLTMRPPPNPRSLTVHSTPPPIYQHYSILHVSFHPLSFSHSLSFPLSLSYD